MEDWPMFRGPNGSGVSGAATPPQEFGPNQNVVWKAEVPGLRATDCAVVKDRIFLNAYLGGKLETRAYSSQGGKLLWTVLGGSQGNRGVSSHGWQPRGWHAGLRQRAVVSPHGSCGLVAYTVEGQELWCYPMPVALMMGGYGSGTSPLIAGDSVIINRDIITNSSRYRFDLKTGKLKWTWPRWTLETVMVRRSYGATTGWRKSSLRALIC